MKFYGPPRKITIEELYERTKEDSIRESERLYNEAIEEVVQELLEHNVKIILLAGPSSSGKTTTAKKIALQLIEHHKQVNVISLDDFYKEKEHIQVLPDGNRDFEAFESFDLPYFKSVTQGIFQEQDMRYCTYDFGTGKRSQLVQTLRNSKDTIFIFEGIHALNPKMDIASMEDRCKRIYIATNSAYYMNDEEVITPQEVRFVRRAIRDYYHRFTSIQETIRQWPDVMQGEHLYIKPYLYLADYFINTSHAYELFLYHAYIESLSEHVEDFNEDIINLRKLVQGKVEIYSKDIPKESMIQEFLP